MKGLLVIKVFTGVCIASVTAAIAAVAFGLGYAVRSRDVERTFGEYGIVQMQKFTLTVLDRSYTVRSILLRNGARVNTDPKGGVTYSPHVPLNLNPAASAAGK